MLREPLVDERVVRIQQIEHAAIFADEAVEEQFRLALHRAGERLVVLRVQQVVGEDLIEILQTQPLRCKPRRQRFRSRIGEHPLDLLLETRRGPQRTLGRRLDQFGVGNGVPEER